MEALNVILDILGILAIICLGAFVVVLIADLILSTFDGHEGVFFHRNKRQNDNHITYNPTPATSPEQEQKNEATVIPYYEAYREPEPEQKPVEEVSAVDFQKAAEEQKMLQGRGFVKEAKPKVVEQPMFAEIEDEEDESAALTEAIKETTKIALEQIEAERNFERDELIKKQQEELARLKEENIKNMKKAEKKPEKKVVVIKQEEDKNAKELKKLRDDIFSLRRSAFKDLQEAKETSAENEIKQTKREYGRQIKAKLKELDQLKLDKDRLDAEREELLKYKKAALDKHDELEKVAKEKEMLEVEIEELRKLQESNTKPYYSKEYYLNKLEALTQEIKDVEKELKANKREFIPLQRIKKSYDRDQEKLRRKEAIVAKQKIAIYGVKSAANIDPKRKEKLDEEVKVLNELKESVFHCDQVLKQNKDRYPVLEKANKLLTKTYNRLLTDMENVKTALAWYEENEGEDNGKKKK